MGAILQEQVDAINDLRTLLEGNLVNEKDRTFAGDLLSCYDKKGSLSCSQWVWVPRLVHRAIEGDEPETVKLDGDLSGMLVMFEFAKQSLKYPKVRLQLHDGSPVVLSVSGLKAKQPGTVNVTDGKPYGSNKWYGRVDKSGTFQLGHHKYPEINQVIALLNNFAKDPQQAAAAHGHLSGSCCFCNKSLTDPKSVKVGYGPTCAKTFGLKWGKTRGK